MMKIRLAPRFFLSFLLCMGCLIPPLLSLAEDVDSILTGKVVTTVTRGVPVPFNAIIEEILVKPGDAVSTGSPLIRYRLQDEAERVLQKEMTIGAGTEQLKGQVLDFERELTNLTAERNKTRQLVSSGLGSRQALARQEENLKAIQNRIALLRTTIAKNERNFASRLKELETYFNQPIKEGETLPETLVLTSPIDGYVLSIAAAMNPGQLINAGTSPIQVGQMDPVLIQIPVYEAEINNIKVGDEAEVEIPSLGKKAFKGVVNEISWISTDMDVANPSYYNVEVTVPNPDMSLKPGFKAIVRFPNSGQRR